MVLEFELGAIIPEESLLAKRMRELFNSPVTPLIDFEVFTPSTVTFNIWTTNFQFSLPESVFYNRHLVDVKNPSLGTFIMGLKPIASPPVDLNAENAIIQVCSRENLVYYIYHLKY